MGYKEFQPYIDRVNARAGGFPVMVNCFRCGKAIEEEVSIVTTFDPPRWYHPECEPE